MSKDASCFSVFSITISLLEVEGGSFINISLFSFIGVGLEVIVSFLSFLDTTISSNLLLF
jgi:hypothetical protein